ncbi:hypothetical protein ACFYY1_29790 [Streptomyces sp. NPDC001890]|uniref:hypothetical protein n=1 Tax=Streptomyces sp. NPDC001890 TaxID=3364620 RepID=UPI0036AD121E
MNWADLLNALLVAGFVLPPLLAVFRLIPFAAALTVQTTACTATTVWTFLRGDAEGTVWYACLTVFFVLLLCRDHRRSKARRRDQDHARTTDRTPGPERAASQDRRQGRDRGMDQVHVITTLKKP